MLLPRVMGNLPTRVDYRTLPNLDDAIASVEARVCGGLDEIDVRPLKLVVMNIIGNFAK